MNRQNKLTVVLGKKGYGKTSFVVAETDKLSRLVIFDYNREYEKGKIIIEPWELINQYRLNRTGSFRLIYRPHESIDIQKHFEYFSEICFLVPNQTVVIEEVDMYSSAGVMPTGLKQLINYGRHKAINLYALSRRAHMIPRDLTANADEIISFQQQEPRDIKYLTDYMGEEAIKVKDLKKESDYSEFLIKTDAGVSYGRNYFIKKMIEKNIPLDGIENRDTVNAKI